MMTQLNQLPTPAKRNIALHLTAAAERAVRHGHPWVYEQSIRKQSKTGAPGDIAIIFDHKERFLAVGVYDPHSPIRVKVLQVEQPVRIDTDFFRQRLAGALDRRRTLLAQTATTGYRLVYGEGDGLPALIIDRYSDVCVIKLYSALWFAHLQNLIEALNTLLPDQTLVLRFSRAVGAGITYGLHDGICLQGTLPQTAVTFREQGLTFAADVIHGHKTGFFFDQRDNRYRVRQRAHDKTVLDVFAYNGGFTVNAAAGGAKSVLSIDISAPALASAQANLQRNVHLPAVAHCQHTILCDDAFSALAQLADEHRHFDMVIVDPPTFASKQSQIDSAKQAYRKLVQQALPLVQPDGILVMASCSSRIPADTFFALVQETACQQGYTLHEIDRHQHALDHPITFPEGAYLKCLFAHVTA